MRADVQAFAKAVDNLLIFALQMHSNIVSLNKHSVRHSFKTAEANRETVITKPPDRRMEIKFNSTFKFLLDKYYLSESLNFMVDLPDELRQMVMDKVIVNNFGIGLAKTWTPNSASKPEEQSWHEDDENHFHVDSYADSNKFAFELGVKTLMALAKTFQNKNISNVQLTYSFQTPDMGWAEAVEQNLHDDSEHYISDRLSFHTKRDGQIVVPDTLFNNKHQAFLTIDL